MTPGPLLSDELVRALVAVGQVDILVGVPTLDNADTVGKVVSAVHRSFATHFPRERTVLVNSDGGSKDGTPEIVRGASLRDDETLIAVDSLRTIHRISAPYRGVPGKGAALRTLFAAADLLQARAVAVFDPDLTSMTPEWLPRLVGPVYGGQADFVAAAFLRPPLEGLLVTQLVRPLVRAAYGHRLHDPVAGEFACSGAFASSCLDDPAWSGLLGQQGVELWLPLEALARGRRVAQAPLGSRASAPRPQRPALPEVFGQVVRALLDCLERHEAYWKGRAGSERVPMAGELSPAADPGPAIDPRAMIESFRAGVRDLAPLLEPILSEPTRRGIAALAGGAPPLHYPDELWAATVYEAAGAYHRDVMHREHLVQALVPLYLGRAASFLVESAGRGADAVQDRLDELERGFEERKPDLIRAWTPGTHEVSHG
jgi:hypothetical protein